MSPFTLANQKIFLFKINMIGGGKKQTYFKSVLLCDDVVCVQFSCGFHL